MGLFTHLLQYTLFYLIVLISLNQVLAKWSYPEPEYEFPKYTPITRYNSTTTTTTTNSPITSTTTTTRKPINNYTITTPPPPPITWPPITRSPITRSPITQPPITRPPIIRPKPEPEPYLEPEENGSINGDILSKVETCHMVCRPNTLYSIDRDWKVQTFWSVIRGGYNCRMQELSKKILDNAKYCDLNIKSIDPTTNKTRYYCTHSSILSLASEKVEKEVSIAIEMHARDVSRDLTRLPIYNWPPLPPQVIRNIIEYIYTFGVTKFEEQNDIIGLYVGAFFADIKDLMVIIENHLYETFNSEEQLYQFVKYFGWAHISNNIQLKVNLKRIGSIILKMDKEQFEKFIDNICKSFDYENKKSGRSM